MDNVLTIYQAKTGDKAEIPLEPAALAILKKYNYVLPLIHNTTANKVLHKIFEDLELTRDIPITTLSSTNKNDRQIEYKPFHEVITFHKGRKTFATESLNAGMRPDVVKRIGGWKSDKSFEKYIGYSPELMKEEMNKKNKSKRHLKVA